MDELLIESQYLPPISYFSLMGKYEKVLIEKQEHYQKGTYRNRCYLAGPNGRLRLSIPLRKGKHQHSIIKDVQIAYDHDWQHIHWQSLCSVYRSSPYFEYYEERFEPFYTKKEKYLFNWNQNLMALLLELLDFGQELLYTKEFQKQVEGVEDHRSAILPGVGDTNIKYTQVFEERQGFIKDMSIVDLLFAEGPHAGERLK